MNRALLHELRDQHFKNFSNNGIAIISPGRANIIGEHIDYNDGLSISFAINQAIYLVISPNKNELLNIHAYDLKENFETDFSDLKFSNQGWQRYFINSLVALGLKKPIGLDVTFGSDLPIGGGVSSSSAIVCGFLLATNHLCDIGHNTDTLIDLASQAENGIGLNGGKLDQTSIFKGQKSKVTCIDFFHSSSRSIDLNLQNHHFYLINSGIKHNLVNSEYNKRRQSCEEALQEITNTYPEITSYQKVDQEMIFKCVKDQRLISRATHVVSEIQRMKDAAITIESSNYSALGDLISQSHQSLSKLYEVSTPEVDFLVEQTNQIERVLGSRIMGGGFGGCTINLTSGKFTDEEILTLKESYLDKTGIELTFLEISPSDGVRFAV